jgi:hypothetical protein
VAESISLPLFSGPDWTSRLDPSVGAFGASRDPQDDHKARSVIDGVDDAEVADAQPPKLRSSDFQGARRSRFDSKGEDRAAQPGGVTGRKTPKLTLGDGRELDPTIALAHPSSGS